MSTVHGGISRVECIQYMLPYPSHAHTRSLMIYPHSYRAHAHTGINYKELMINK